MEHSRERFVCEFHDAWYRGQAVICGPNGVFSVRFQGGGRIVKVPSATFVRFAEQAMDILRTRIFTGLVATLTACAVPGIV